MPLDLHRLADRVLGPELPACPGSALGLPRFSPVGPQCRSWTNTCTRGQSPCCVGCPGCLR